MKAAIIIIICTTLLVLFSVEGGDSLLQKTGVGSITFLVTVNDTWKWDPPIENDTCMVTIKTYPISPDTPLNKSENIMVGDCDSGPLVYSVNDGGDGKSSVFLTFHSSVIEDASPPTCTIQWDYSYRVPTSYLGKTSYAVPKESLLPGCGIADSREGYHMTYYWFYLIDWTLTSDVATESTNFSKKWSSSDPQALATISFLVAVNDTEKQCISLGKSPPLEPSVVHNKSEAISAGKCDRGTLDFKITQEKDTTGDTHTYVNLIFYSQITGDGTTPTCKIQWDYSYLVPSTKNPGRSLLPGCYTAAQSKGSHWTYFWFYVIDWSYG